MAKVLTVTSMMNVDHSNQCKQLYQKHGDWYIHPELFVQENPGTTRKSSRKGLKNLNFAYIMFLLFEILLSTCALP